MKFPFSGSSFDYLDEEYVDLDWDDGSNTAADSTENPPLQLSKVSKRVSTFNEPSFNALRQETEMNVIEGSGNEMDDDDEDADEKSGKINDREMYIEGSGSKVFGKLN